MPSLLQDENLQGELILLGGVVGCVWLILLVLFAAVYRDRIFPCFRRTRNSRSAAERFGDLSMDERKLVLDVLFPPNSYRTSERFETVVRDVENQHSDVTVMQQRQQHDLHTLETNVAEEVKAVCSFRASTVEHDRTCAICLQNYADGDHVVKGRNCTHVFHKDCVMGWLESHDLCPCCRKEMMTADEMRNAALQVLNQAEVKDLPW